MRHQTRLLLVAALVSSQLLFAACGASSAPTTANPSEAGASSGTPSTAASGASADGDIAYPIVDTNQGTCYDATSVIECSTTSFAGQDAQLTGSSPSYTDNGDGTITDNVTGLVWQKSPDTNGDASITATDKLSYAAAGAYCESLTDANQDDWQLPTIKQPYSLMDFSGVDPSGYEGTDTSGLIPFIDTDYFDFAYGDSSAGERIVDSQYASSTTYVGNDGQYLFGVNFADGRIKGYGLTLRGQDKTFFVGDGEASSSESTTAQAVATPAPGGASTTEQRPGGGPEGGPGGRPDLAAAARQLGVTEEELIAALGEPGTQLDLDAAAEELNVTMEALDAALAGAAGAPPDDDD